jgi:hypothetical protein
MVAAGLFFWASLARADHGSGLVLAFALRAWSPHFGVVQSAEGPLFERWPPGRLVVGHDSAIVLAGLFQSPFDVRSEERFAELDSALRVEPSTPLSVRFGGEPFERKVFDFERRCLNPCPLGGWGTCVLDIRPIHDECEAIVGRTLVSSAARRAPLVREILRLVGARTTRLPTDVDRGLELSAGLVQGGGTLRIEARW